MSVRIGVDVGGTFTDFVCFDEAKGELKLLKVPCTPREPHRAVIDGTARLIKEYQFPASGSLVSSLHTADSFQGKQADVVMVSLVRNNQPVRGGRAEQVRHGLGFRFRVLASTIAQLCQQTLAAPWRGCLSTHCSITLVRSGNS